MPLLTIDLQDGFTGEHVEIHVNAEKIFDKTGIKTRTQIGFADRCVLSVEDGPVRIELTLPGKKIRKVKDLTAIKDTFIGINMNDSGSLDIQEQSSEFGYL